MLRQEGKGREEEGGGKKGIGPSQAVRHLCSENVLVHDSMMNCAKRKKKEREGKKKGGKKEPSERRTNFARAPHANSRRRADRVQGREKKEKKGKKGMGILRRKGGLTIPKAYTQSYRAPSLRV